MRKKPSQIPWTCSGFKSRLICCLTSRVLFLWIGCNKKMKQMAAMGQDPNQYQQQQQQSPLRRSRNNAGGDDDGDIHSALGVSLLAEGSYDYNYPTEEGEGEEGSSYIAFFWYQFDWSPEDEAAEDALPLYHPGSLKQQQQQQKRKKESNNNGSNHNGSSGRDIGIIVLSIVITCLYCVAVFGAIYLVLLLLNYILVGLWTCVFGRCGSSQDNDADADADAEDEGEVEAVEDLDLPLLGGEAYSYSS